MASYSRPSRRDQFKIAIICALPFELDAVLSLLDDRWEGALYGRLPGDKNTYTTGRIDHHNVVLAVLDEMGTVSAAVVAMDLKSSFENIELTLLVGVCGGVPKTKGGEGGEILLGDVVISQQVIRY